MFHNHFINLFILVLSLLVVFGVERIIRFCWLRWTGLPLTLVIRDTDTEILDAQNQRILKALNHVEFGMLDYRPNNFVTIWGEQSKLFDSGTRDSNEVQSIDLVHDPVVLSEEFCDCWGGFFRGLCDLARHALNANPNRTLRLQVVTWISNAEINRKIEREIQNPILQAFGHFRVLGFSSPGATNKVAR